MEQIIGSILSDTPHDDRLDIFYNSGRIVCANGEDITPSPGEISFPDARSAVKTMYADPVWGLILAELPDELDPDQLFNGTSNELLCQIARGEIDPVRLARKSLANRGLDDYGQWIGFEKAHYYHQTRHYVIDQNGNKVARYLP